MIFQKLKEIIAEELGIEEDMVQTDSILADDLGADSLDAMELIMAVEEVYDLQIEDSEATNIKTVKDIIDYIENQKK